jgi:hypothetical protein
MQASGLQCGSHTWLERQIGHTRNVAASDGFSKVIVTSGQPSARSATRVIVVPGACDSWWTAGVRTRGRTGYTGLVAKNRSHGVRGFAAIQGGGQFGPYPRSVCRCGAADLESAPVEDIIGWRRPALTLSGSP